MMHTSAIPSQANGGEDGEPSASLGRLRQGETHSTHALLALPVSSIASWPAPNSMRSTRGPRADGTAALFCSPVITLAAKKRCYRQNQKGSKEEASSSQQESLFAFCFD